ncbi:MAG TPA: hypothetical protein VFQ42_08920 [Mycobacterium sp.]|nr:hypothetical protein [Mycobacterium sp.]
MKRPRHPLAVLAVSSVLLATALAGLTLLPAVRWHVDPGAVETLQPGWLFIAVAATVVGLVVALIVATDRSTTPSAGVAAAEQTVTLPATPAQADLVLSGRLDGGR